ETHTIQVLYDVAGLTPGVHSAAITVAAPGALNSPQTIAVHLTLSSVKSDFDQDGDVDQADFGHFQACFSGPGVPQTNPDCLNAMLDGDDDVDQDDFAIFQRCLGGAEFPPPPACER